MIEKTSYTVDLGLLTQATQQLPNIDYKLSINQPTGRFFYDQWEIKPEFKDTIWDRIINTLKEPIGEARLIKMEPGTCYSSHADIDDRYHLNITGERSYLIDLDNNQMHQTSDRGVWYTMNTSRRHTAANFGSIPRIQLVVRHLLCDNKLTDFKRVSIGQKLHDLTQDSRYVFDDVLSPWLNYGCKAGFIGNVSATVNSMTFDINSNKVEHLNELLRTTGLVLTWI